MAKQTLLELVQNIASAIEADEINSISDTVESYQIARVVQESYFELVEALNIPSNNSLILLDASGDTAKPNYLKIPDDVKQIEWFKYDYQNNGVVGDYIDIKYLTPDEFIFRTINNSGLEDEDGNPLTTQVVDFSGATLNIVTNQNPVYWTTFDNEWIVTDGYDSTSDTTLQQSKSLAWGQNDVTFTLQDDFIPDLDDSLFPLLLAESKSVCFFNQKQMPSPKEEQRAKRQLVRAQNNFWKANQRKPYDRVPNYGRRRGCVNPLNPGT